MSSDKIHLACYGIMSDHTLRVQYILLGLFPAEHAVCAFRCAVLSNAGTKPRRLVDHKGSIRVTTETAVVEN
jgi:hypothetical protein